DRVDVARFVMTAYSVHVLQLTVLTASRGLTTLARRTAEAQQAQARIANHQLVAAAVHKARRMRSELVQQTVAELLGKLARGDAVSVAVVSDAEADVPARHHAEVDFSYDNEGGLSWAETRWTASSPSRS